MKDINYNDIQIGQELYACAYATTNTKEKKRFSQMPIKGMIMAGNTRERHNAVLKLSNCPKPNYFVPFGTNKRLSWSKAIHFQNYHYADTEQECIELYDDLIQNEINWHKAELQKLEEDLMTTNKIQ